MGIEKIKLPFKKSFGYTEKEVPILINMGTLENVCVMLEVEFGDLSDSLKEKGTDFFVAIMYQGYLSACKEVYQKPKYTFHHAVIWQEHISQGSMKKLLRMVETFIGKYKITDSKKKVK